jgi:hypothetical protein
MVIKKYNLTLRNFNANIINTLLKKSGYYSIEQYEFETDYDKFDFFIDSNTNHVSFVRNNVEESNYGENYITSYIPLSYLTDDCKEYFFNKYISKNGFDSFDQYFICYSYTMPCILVNIPKKLNSEPQVQAQAQTQTLQESEIENLCSKNVDCSSELNVDKLFSIEPIIDFKNLYCKYFKNKLMVRAFNIELDRNTRPNDYKTKTWNIFNTIIKYNRHQKAWVFPMMYKQELLNNGVNFI